MSGDPTLKTYTIPYVPFNDQTVNSDYYPRTIKFTQMYQLPVPGLNQTIAQVLTNPAYHDAKITSIQIRLTGNHKYYCGSGTFVTLTLYDTAGNSHGPFFYQDDPGDNVTVDTSNISISGALGNPPPLDNYKINFGRIRTSCARYDFNNITLTFTVNLQVGLCNAQSINNAQCVNYCNDANNLGTCLPDYLSYCLNPTAPTIGTNLNCQNFFQTYLGNAKYGPNAKIDNGLNAYCAAKYKNFADLFNGTNQIDKDLCGCHMPNELYVQFASELSQRYPSLSNLGNLGVNNRCIVPQCSSSPYPSTVSRITCALPNCLNVATFNNDGTLGPVTVNQSGNCASISGGGGNGGGSNGGGVTPGPTSTPDSTTIPGSKPTFKESIRNHSLIFIIISTMAVVLFGVLLMVIHSPILRIIFAILLVLAFIFLIFVLYVRFFTKPPTTTTPA